MRPSGGEQPPGDMRMMMNAMDGEGPDAEDSASMSGSSDGSGSGSDDGFPDAAPGNDDRSPTVSPTGLGPAGKPKQAKPAAAAPASSSWDKWLSEPAMTPGDKIQAERERKERALKKAKLMAKFDRRNTYRKVKIEYNPGMTLEELEAIDERDGYAKRSELSVKVLRRLLVFFCKFVEWASHRFPKMALDLEGWSESVYLTLDTYDEILYDIHDEYFSGAKMNPLAQLFVQLSTNAVMYSMAKKIMNSPMAEALGTAFVNQAKLGGQQQQAPQPQPAQQAAAPQQANLSSRSPAGAGGLAAMFGSLFGGGAGGGPATMGLDDADLGGGAPDLNSIFTAVGNMLNNVPRQPMRSSEASGASAPPEDLKGQSSSSSAVAPQVHPSPRTSISADELSSSGPVDLRNINLPDSNAPAPMARAPHVNDTPALPAIGRDRYNPGGAVLISVLRQQEDLDQGKRLPTIVELPDEEDEIPDPEESSSASGSTTTTPTAEDMKTVTLPDAPANKRGGARRNKVNINDIS